MKIIKRAVFQMTDTIGEYIHLEESSYEYDGPIAHAGGEEGEDPIPSQLPAWASNIIKENAELASNYGLAEFDWAKAQQGTQQELMEGILETQQGAATQMFANADEWRERYATTFQPLEDQLVADAEDYASDWRREQEAGRAAADVSQAFDAERESTRQRLEGYGIDPSQTRAAAIDANVSMNEALAKAGAQNQARRDVDDKARNLRAQAIQLGIPLQDMATQAEAQGFNMAGAAGQTYSQNLAASQGLRQQAVLPYMQSANQALGQTRIGATPGTADKPGWGGAAGKILGSAAGAYAGSTAGSAAITAGLAMIKDGGAIESAQNSPYAAPPAINDPRYPMMGRYAEGGPVMPIEGGGELMPREAMYDMSRGYSNVGMQDGQIDGPGGPKDDLIDAKLSDGEYVIPAETVKYKGTEFFDKLVTKTKEAIPPPQQMGQAMVTPPPNVPTDVQPEAPTVLPMAYGGYAAIPSVPMACGGYVTRRK
jgi:hypothetical protein